MKTANRLDMMYSGELPRTQASLTLSESRFVSRTYGWMFIGLIVTALASLAVVSSEQAAQFLLGNRVLFYGAMIAEFGLVIGLSAGIKRISAAGATLLFLLYSALNGFTLSMIFFAYSLPSIGTAFLLCAGMFGGMSVFGSITKRNLSRVGTFFVMGLWGLVLVSLVNIFVVSEALNFGLGVIGIVIFAGLAAFDAQKIRALAREYSAPTGTLTADGMGEKGAIFGALMLYLDFINLFLSLLRVFGRRR